MKKRTTKELLIETIKELMTRQPLDNITVKDILEASGVSRPSFYKYFYDKHDLVESVFKQELADPFFWDFTKNLQEREVLFLRHLAHNRSFYLNALKSSDQNSFYNMWMDLASSSLLGYFRTTRIGEEIDDADLVFASKYLAYAWVNMNISWLRESDGLSAEEMEAKLTAMMEYGMQGLRRKRETGK